jgi:arylsulfatase A-like enzyme
MRRLLPLLWVAALAACHTPARGVAVLITIDTLRADYLGASRDGVALTPRLDAFARDAIRYDDVVANASMTVPSHAALLTGQQPFRSGALTNDGVLPSNVPTLAEALQARGLLTGAVVSSFTLRPEAGLARGFGTYESRLDSKELNRRRQLVKSPEETTRAALAWVRASAPSRFFLWVHYFPPHGPYTPPGEFLEGLAAPTPDPARALAVSDRNFERGAIPAYQRYADEIDPEAYRRRYAGAVRQVDHHVGELLDGLRDAGLYDAATIAITSDHGESLGEHGWYFTHANLVYDEQVRIPLLLKLPGGRGAGSRVAAPVESVDLAPTLLEILGFGGALPGDGRVVLPGSPGGPLRPRFTLSLSAELRAVIDGRHKLILRTPVASSNIEAAYPDRALFDLQHDPGELQDRAASDPETARRLEAVLRSRSLALGQPPIAPTSEDVEALRALGYVH